MTEKTGRRRSLSRRTILAGTAGVLGGTMLAAPPAHAQTGAPAASASKWVILTASGGTSVATTKLS
jgi:hypothetical protein